MAIFRELRCFAAEDMKAFAQLPVAIIRSNKFNMAFIGDPQVALGELEEEHDVTARNPD